MAMHLIINVIYSLHKFRWSPLASHASVWYMSPVEKFARMTYRWQIRALPFDLRFLHPWWTVCHCIRWCIATTKIIVLVETILIKKRRVYIWSYRYMFLWNYFRLNNSDVNIIQVSSMWRHTEKMVRFKFYCYTFFIHILNHLLS